MYTHTYTWAIIYPVRVNLSYGDPELQVSRVGLGQVQQSK